MLDNDALNLIAPFDVGRARGPDLVSPRLLLRIVPGNLGGAPHVHRTRVESGALRALNDGGLQTAVVYELYPDLPRGAIDEALDLEAQLQGGLAA